MNLIYRFVLVFKASKDELTTGTITSSQQMWSKNGGQEVEFNRGSLVAAALF